MKVLFVCTGNICRSPTAETVFRHRVAVLGIADRITADSAGTSSEEHGFSTDLAADPRHERLGLGLAGSAEDVQFFATIDRSQLIFS